MKYAKEARKARRKVLEMIYRAQTSHIGSNLSCIDIMTVLFDKMKLDRRLRPDRDRFVLSKGWAAASLYYFLAEKGVIPKKDLKTYCLGDSKYIGLAEPYVRGVEAAGGSMGHGLPMAVGMALAAKRSGETWHTYCLMSDGEVACGTTWECLLIAAQHKLDNLTVIVDMNGFQALGRTEDILNLDGLGQTIRTRGWVVREIDGHDHAEIEKAISMTPKGRPVCILANTIKGKGVPEMEGKIEWHYRNIQKEVYKRALKNIL